MSARTREVCDALVAERRELLLATPQARARYRAYLDTLARTHAGDPAMAAHVERSTAELAAREEAS